MVSNSNNLKKNTEQSLSHLKSTNTNSVEIQVLDWDKYRNASGLNWLIGPQSLSRLMDLQRDYGKKSNTDSLRHFWFVFHIALTGEMCA